MKTWWQRSIDKSVDAWEHAKPNGKWTKVSADHSVLDAMMKEKYVVKERQRKRRKVGDLYDMLEKADAKEKGEERDKNKLQVRSFSYKERRR